MMLIGGNQSLMAPEATEIHGAASSRQKSSQQGFQKNTVWPPHWPHQTDLKQDGGTSSLVPAGSIVVYSLTVSVLPSMEKASSQIIEKRT